jgi:hypothetical protein
MNSTIKNIINDTGLEDAIKIIIDNEDLITKTIQQFQEKYRSSTSGDLQTGIIVLNMYRDIIRDRLLFVDAKELTYKEAIHLIVYNKLPLKFDNWTLHGNTNWTVAHAAAKRGCLPENFDQWDIANKDGWTVAHVAAIYNNLPKGFTQWELATNDGWTVAHSAAEHGNLPEGFDKLDLVDNNGMTVQLVRDSCIYFPDIFKKSDLIKMN